MNCKYNQDFYDEEFMHLNFSVIKCPKCGAVGFFHYFGHYARHLFNNGSEYIYITRIQCEKCHSTHALLPDLMIPYRYFSAPFMLKLFTFLLVDKISISKIAKILKLSIATLGKLIKHFKDLHEERLLIINPELMHPLDQQFLGHYFRMFSFLFMQSSPRISNFIFHGMIFT